MTAEEHQLPKYSAIAYIQEHCHIDVDNVALSQLPAVRDAVADDFVDGGADALWEAAVPQRRRVGPGRDRGLVHGLVDRVGLDPGPNQLAGQAQHPARKLAGGPSGGHVPVRALNLRAGVPIGLAPRCRIRRAGNVPGDLADGAHLAGLHLGPVTQQRLLRPSPPGTEKEEW